jgi:hypothetical protein
VSIVCSSARDNTISRYWSIALGGQCAFVDEGDTVGVDVTNIVAVDWKASELMGENSGIRMVPGYSVRVARGGVFDDGWVKPEIVVGG